jgi:hypothetical protein
VKQHYDILEGEVFNKSLWPLDFGIRQEMRQCPNVVEAKKWRQQIELLRGEGAFENRFLRRGKIQRLGASLGLFRIHIRDQSISSSWTMLSIYLSMDRQGLEDSSTRAKKRWLIAHTERFQTRYLEP